MGGKIVDGAFAVSIKPLVQHEQVLSWPSHLQVDLEATCQRDTNLGTGGRQQPRQICCQSPQGCYCPWRWSLRVISQVFRHFSGTERLLLVKFLIEESMVKLLPSASSLHSLYYLTCFARSSFIKCMHLTRDGYNPQ